MNNNLDIKAVGIALGLTWAIGAFIIGIFAWLSAGENTTALVNLIGRFYIGFTPTFLGSIVGALWGFIDAFIGGVIFAWLYNKLAK
jgi:hypothetical protein